MGQKLKKGRTKVRRVKLVKGIQSEVKIKAVLDARDVPIDLFGSGKGRMTRKFVFMMIATWADPDGTNSYPSVKTIAGNCGMTERGARKIILWLETNGLLIVEYKSGPHGTNKYTVNVTDGSQSRACAEYALRPKTELKTGGSTARYGADTRNALVPGLDGNNRNVLVPGTPGTIEHPTRNDSAADPERWRTYPEPIGSPDRPLDRPLKAQSVNHRPTDRPAVGWLAGELAKLFQKETGRVCTPTKAELENLDCVVAQISPLMALLAFFHFLERTKGVDDLFAPFTVFLNEINVCVEVVKPAIPRRERVYTEGSPLFLAKHQALHLTALDELLRGSPDDNSDHRDRPMLMLRELIHLQSELTGEPETIEVAREFINNNSDWASQNPGPVQELDRNALPRVMAVVQ
jgi:hypothetical protein